MFQFKLYLSNSPHQRMKYNISKEWNQDYNSTLFCSFEKNTMNSNSYKFLKLNCNCLIGSFRSLNSVTSIIFTWDYYRHTKGIETSLWNSWPLALRLWHHFWTTLYICLIFFILIHLIYLDGRFPKSDSGDSRTNRILQ